MALWAAAVRRGRRGDALCRRYSTSAVLHAAFRTTLPALQQGGAAPKKKKEGGGPAAAAEEKFDLTKVIPVNLLKEGPEPEYKPDSEYPAWVFTLAEEKPLLEDMVAKGLENVPDTKMKQVLRMVNKRRIKDGNDSRRKMT